MASVGECAEAVFGLVDRLAEVDPELRRKHAASRTVSCRVPDLQTTWTGRLSDDGLQDVTTEDGGRAQVRLTISSDDLVALAGGALAVPVALATGRLRVQASPLDLLRLRALL